MGTGKKIFAFTMCIAMFIPWVFPSAADAGDGHHRSEKVSVADAGETPLIEEMELLDGVFREVVSGVAVGDGEQVHKALQSMHGAMEKTHEGVHEGTVKIPKNADREEEFIQMDKTFHRDLERLAQAAHQNDWQGMLSITKSLLDMCVQCHREFRE